ncbi:VCBS repeat-containing protein [Roseomonas sp. AR75]|uniref:FG-GAP repeat domain-containing protein n=1 Tax=Roseomonas sp. AR75 TaxID=2562311 RepID=UPI0010BFE1AD|nr:VCBS repeat-containing protein [Roseomonas sp. AR75]
MTAGSLPDSRITWRFLAHGGDSWGGTLIADTGLHDAGDTLPGAFGTYTILTVEDQGIDLSALGLEDGQVFVDWYWDVQTAQFLATRNGAGTAAGAAGLGSEQDFAWTGLAWMAFGMAGAQQADAALVAADARFTWVFEANSGDRWGGVLYDLAASFDVGSTLATAHGLYRITGEDSLGGEAAAAGSVRLTGDYFDNASGLQFSIADADGSQEHGSAGLGSEAGAAWNGAVWVPFGQGGGLQADPPAGPRLALSEFGFVAGSWSAQSQYPRGAADVNGDGRADIFGFGNAGMWVSLANASGGFDAPYLAVSNFGFVAGSWLSQDLYPRSVTDVDGDGLADVVGFGNAGVWVALADGIGGFEPMRLVLNGFGYQAGSWLSQDRFPRAMADVNGDGRADVVGFGNAGVWVALADGTGGFGPMRLALDAFGFVAGSWESQDNFPRGMADVNGDGLADVYGFGNAGVWIALADGAGGFEASRLVLGAFGRQAGSWENGNLFPRQLADMNGDGLADVVGFGNAGVWVALADGTGGFEDPVLAVEGFGVVAGSWESQDRYPRLAADVTGDGRAEVIGFGNAGVWIEAVLSLG